MIFDLLTEIQNTLKFISDYEEKICKDTHMENVYLFHRGRQLMVIDILKTINSIFHHHDNYIKNKESSHVNSL